MANKQGISYWYIVIFLSFITVAVWFFIEFNQSQKSTFTIKTAQAAANPIKNSFNQQAIDDIQTRLVIPRLELAKIQPYTSKSVVNSATIKNKVNNSQSTNSTSDPEVASASADLNQENN